MRNICACFASAIYGRANSLFFSDGYDGYTGTFKLSVVAATQAPTPAPTTALPTEAMKSMEEGCETATAITAGSPVMASTVGQPMFTTEQCGGAYPHNTRGKWYTIQGTGNGVTASLCGNTFYDSMVCVLCYLVCPTSIVLHFEAQVSLFYFSYLVDLSLEWELHKSSVCCWQ